MKWNTTSFWNRLGSDFLALLVIVFAYTAENYSTAIMLDMLDVRVDTLAIGFCRTLIKEYVSK